MTSWSGFVGVCVATFSIIFVGSLANYNGAARAESTTQKTNPERGSILLVIVYLDLESVGRNELCQRNGSLFATDAQLKKWNLTRRAKTPGVQFKDRTWFSLVSIPETEVVHYFAEKRVEIRTSAAIDASVMDAPSPTPIKPESKDQVAAPAAKTAAAPVTSPVVVESGTPRRCHLRCLYNGAKTGNWLLLERAGVLYAPADAFEEWRLNRRPDAKSYSYRGQTWFPLTSVPGFQAQLNAADQSMDLKFQSGAFAATRVTQAPTERPNISEALPSLFLNYDLSYTASDVRGIDTSKDLGALIELGFSNSLGVLTSSHVGQNLTNEGDGDKRLFRRLETTFSRDFPDKNLSLRVGDTASRQGMWGRSTYFGGIQLGRNFALSPGFITQPLPTIAGQSKTTSRA